MNTELLQIIEVTIRAYNEDSTLHQYALLQDDAGVLIALASNEPESGGMNVVVCINDARLESTIEEKLSLRKPEDKTFDLIREAFFERKLHQWRASFW